MIMCTKKIYAGLTITSISLHFFLDNISFTGTVIRENEHKKLLSCSS